MSSLQPLQAGFASPRICYVPYVKKSVERRASARESAPGNTPSSSTRRRHRGRCACDRNTSMNADVNGVCLRRSTAGRSAIPCTASQGTSLTARKSEDPVHCHILAVLPPPARQKHQPYGSCCFPSGRRGRRAQPHTLREGVCCAAADPSQHPGVERGLGGPQDTLVCCGRISSSSRCIAGKTPQSQCMHCKPQGHVGPRNS